MPGIATLSTKLGLQQSKRKDPFVAAERAILACALHDDRPRDVQRDGVTDSCARRSAPVEDPVILTANSKVELLLESSFLEPTKPAVDSRHSVKHSHCELR